MALSTKQQRFVAEYAIDQNATKAAIRAGYSERRAAVTASELMRLPEVQRKVHVTDRKILTELEITATDITRVAWELATDTKTMAIARVKALELLAKRHHEFSDKHEITGDVRVRMEALTAVAQMTPEQLKALAENARS